MRNYIDYITPDTLKEVLKAGNVIPDNQKIIYGDSGEVEMYYDSTNQVFKIFSQKLTSFGFGNSSHSLTGVGDVYISGSLEVDSNAYFDSYVSIAAYRSIDIGTGIYLYSGLDQTISTIFNKIIFGPRNYRTYSYGHGTQTNPTLYIHSATDPNIDNTQYGLLTHNQEDFVISSGTGRIRTDVGLRYNTNEVNTSTYTISYNDEIISVSYTTTGTVTITLPDSLAKAGNRFLIIDVGGNASVNNITINTNTKTINGSTSYVISTNYGFVEIISDGNNFFAR